MPVLHTERQVAPRSALRYQPMADQAGSTGPVVARKTRVRADSRAAALKVVPDDLDREEEISSPPRRPRVPPVPRKNVPPPASRISRHIHPLVFMGIGLLLALGLWIGISQLIAWGTSELNTIKYGYPRTSQMDAVLGHDDSAAHPSHLTAMNLHGQTLVIEFPGGDATHAKVYLGPQLFGANSDLVPITLSLINPNHASHPDLLIDAGDLRSVLINTGTGFRAPTPAEMQQLAPGK
jgi:hypothetical protein